MKTKQQLELRSLQGKVNYYKSRDKVKFRKYKSLLLYMSKSLPLI